MIIDPYANAGCEIEINVVSHHINNDDLEKEFYDLVNPTKVLFIPQKKWLGA